MSSWISREFVSLQLTLVHRCVELGLVTCRDGVDRLTNVQRRLGLAPQPGIDPNRSRSAAWNVLLDEIEAATTLERQVDVVMDASRSLPPALPEHIVRNWPTVGAFSIEVSGTVGRTHFFATETGDRSPLHRTELALRHRELVAVLAMAREQHPRLDHVAGGSWLYAGSAYRSLFPAEHLARAVVRRDVRTLRGMSHWGQFLDHRGDVRTELADTFLRNVRAWTGGDPCVVFPIATLELMSPISVFDGRWATTPPTVDDAGSGRP